MRTNIRVFFIDCHDSVPGAHSVRFSWSSMTSRLGPVLSALAWILISIIGVTHPQHYSEESILSATIDDPVFGGLWETERHMSIPYFDPKQLKSITQRMRLDLLISALNATITALNASNIPVFLDAGVLLGWYRHDGGMIPWDIDADVGILTDDCLRKYPDQRELENKIRSILPSPYVIEYFDCNTAPEKGRSFAGIVADSRNGMKVDIFGFRKVDASNDSYSWRKKGSWLQRDLDRDIHHKVFPFESIFPLRSGNFSGIIGEFIPNDPKTALQWDFGFSLEPPVFPHGLSLKVFAHPVSILFVVVIFLNWGTYGDKLIAALSILLLDGGFRVFSLFLAIARNRFNKSPKEESQLFTLVSTIALGLLLADFLPLFPQAFALIMEALGASEFSVNKHRYCFLYKVFCIES
jgi:hypothetical protein